MSQDTRKDKRAKVVSLNVRYKSATVDEFIENHSHDVSKGGIFVKTPTPFPPGTLLKFEIRLAGDKSVISGVGRVVWKREPTQAAADRPAGMGVKFIKIDDASRATIDRLVAHDPSAGRAYTSELTAAEADTSHQPSTLRGLVAAPSNAPEAAKHVPVSVPAPSRGSGQTLPVPPSGPSGAPTTSTPLTPPPPKPAFGAASSSRSFGAGTAGAVPPKASAPTPRPASAGPPPPVAHKPATSLGVAPAPNGPTSEPRLGGPPRPQAANRKATMMGIGMPSTPPGASQPDATTKPPPAAEPMFPRLDAPDSSTEQVREPTVMKQAAELLEEALKEAGGSMDEIGQNPLFMKTGGEIVATPTPPPGPVDSVRSQSGDTIIMSSPSQNAAGPGPASAPAQPAASAPGVTPVPPPPTAPVAPVASPASAPITSATGQRPAQASGQHGKLSDALAPPKKKGGGGVLVVLVLVLVAAGAGAFYAFKTGMLAGVIGPAEPPPSATSSAEPPASAPPSASASAPAMVPEGDAAVAEAGASATSTTDAGKGGDAGAAHAADAGKAAVAPPQPPRPTWHPPPPKPPKPPTEPSATATATGTATSTAPTSTATSTAPTATSTSTSTAPAPAPTPTKNSDDPF